MAMKIHKGCLPGDGEDKAYIIAMSIHSDMKAKACAYCGKPISNPSVRRYFRRFCSDEHLEKFVEKKEFWKGLDDSGNIGGPGC